MLSVRRNGGRPELEPPITLASQKRIWRLTQRLVDMPNVVEAIPGMNNITVILREPQTLALDAIERLQRWWEESEALEPDSRSVEIPVIYGGAGGPDLAAVARHSGLSEKQVVELHASVEYVVWFLGFQPGFPYLGNLPEPLHMPRRAEPRLQVPAGSVGIGGAQTGIYPLSTPGGWQLIGLTPLKLFDPMRETPVLLRPAIAYALCRKRREYAEYYSRGIYTSVQDSGRHGFRQSGLSHCGALDKPAFQTANLPVGNDANAPALEITLGQLVVEFENETGSLLPAQAARRSWMINRSGPAGDCR